MVTRPLAEWQPLGKSGPWSSPDQRAVLETRDYHVSRMATVQGHDERWRAPDGRTADAWKACERLVDWLARTGELQRWPETGAHVHNVGAQRLGPYRIYLVSIFPDVALLIPHDYGPIARRSIFDLVGSGENALGDRRIMNHIYYGTTVPATQRVFWISSDLGIPLTPAGISADGRFSVSHAKIELLGQPGEEGISITRLR